jgi:hypothetical protein
VVSGLRSGPCLVRRADIPVRSLSRAGSRLGLVNRLGATRCFGQECPRAAKHIPCLARSFSEQAPSPIIGGHNLSLEPLPHCLQQVTRRARSFFLGPRRAVVQKPTGEANGCILRHVTPKMLQKAPYVGSARIAQPQQVVWFGWPQFPFPEASLAGQAGPFYGRLAQS